MKRLGRGKARYVSTILSAHDGNAFERWRRTQTQIRGVRVGKSEAARLLIAQALGVSAVPENVTKTIRPENYPELEHEAYLALEPETERETLIPSAAEAEELAAESARA